ncbi:MAG: VOC family protein [Baekduia sp.]
MSEHDQQPVAAEHEAGEAGTEPRRMRLQGLHHVTAIVRDLDRTTAFYRDLLGLALLEAGRNEDDPDARLFWFGDGVGTPGTLVSFMEYPSMEEAAQGRGGVHHFAFLVSGREELEAWAGYLEQGGVAVSEIYDRGRFSSLYFRDPDGHLVELATPPAA